MVALEIENHPDAGLIYSDEDKVDENGVRSNPFFKPDWNPELFLGQNFINHLGVYRTELLREIGGFREGFEGSQDYDLALRCVDRLRPAQVRHIPRILYHWRAVAGSLAAVPDAKPYAKEAARRAIGDHLQRQGIAGRVEPCPENVESHRVIYELPDPPPLVSIIIPIRDRVSLLERCLEAIRERTDYRPLEIVIVDNGSKEAATLEFLRALEEKNVARVLRVEGEFNFSRLINRGAAERERRGARILKQRHRRERSRLAARNGEPCRAGWSRRGRGAPLVSKRHAPTRRRGPGSRRRGGTCVYGSSARSCRLFQSHVFAARTARP